MRPIALGQTKSIPTTAADTEATNFYHLYWDVAWFGLAFGSTLSFLAVYATRLGAAGWQIGLLTAGPALLNALLTLPAGRWLETRPLGRSVLLTAILHRLGYLLLVPLPLLLPPQWQIWGVLLLPLLAALPGTALAIGFNALLAATVPPEKRGHVVGRRNALLAGFIMAAFVLSGQILERTPLEVGYTIVFAMGALGLALSTYHLALIRVPEMPRFEGRPLNDQAQPGRGVRSGEAGLRSGVGLRLWLRRHTRAATQAGEPPRISPRFLAVMGAFFFFHFAQMLPGPLFPIFWVREAGLDDGPIGWINAAFYLSMLVAAPLLGRLATRWGNHALTVWGAILLSLYPLLTGLSQGIGLLLVASVLGGMTWAILGGALANRLLEVTPEDDRPAHLAIYNLALNVAMLTSTMLSPFLADAIGLRTALLIAFVLRLAAGLALRRWG